MSAESFEIVCPGMEVLDSRLLETSEGNFIQVWIRGPHPELGEVIRGISGEETICLCDMPSFANEWSDGGVYIGQRNENGKH